jgi:hypothetical protein
MNVLTPEAATRRLRNAGFKFLTIDAVGSLIIEGKVKTYPVSVVDQDDVTTQYYRKTYPEMSEYNNMVSISLSGNTYIRIA